MNTRVTFNKAIQSWVATFQFDFEVGRIHQAVFPDWWKAWMFAVCIEEFKGRVRNGGRYRLSSTYGISGTRGHSRVTNSYWSENRPYFGGIRGTRENWADELSDN